MPTVQVILGGVPRTTVHDTYDFPIVLQFGSQTSYESAVWVIPSFPGRIPARRLSEIRVQQGPVSIIVDGPDGFRSGPHMTDWVRSRYPRGKDCALLQVHSESKSMAGVTLTVFEGTLFIEDIALGGGSAAASSDV
jgi:hypothetical protein